VASSATTDRFVIVTGGPGAGKTTLVDLPFAPIAERVRFVIDTLGIGRS
jgi:predicted ATPase